MYKPQSILARVRTLREEKKRSKAYCVSKLKWRITLYWRMEGVGVRVISHKSRSELAISVVQYSTDPFK